jgi:hypothetical protein
VNTSTGQWIVEDFEKLKVLKDGSPIAAPDFNFWGVTFAKDTGKYFATLGTGGRRFLVEGSVDHDTVRVVREGVECPSLSPDGRHIAFKKRAAAADQRLGIWRIHVIDLATGREQVMAAEANEVDDQVEWVNNEEIVYSLPDSRASATAHLWSLRIDGSSPPRQFTRHASSPAVLR